MTGPMTSQPDNTPTAPLDFARYDDTPAADAAVMLGHAMRAPGLLEQEGDEVGLYTLAEKLGDGGFGSVWRAEQTEPVRREVALKIIKPGMDTLEVMSRFEQERVALSMMDHPNIAKVLDAGATQEGRPFFVMELVRGVSITRHCIEGGLSLEQRLALFRSVCAGVQHAHQKGIIHRDLKPSNILVAQIDGVPVPKIIDFGIAKALTADKLTALTLVTRQEQMIGTPLYMSPEQADSSADIDTRSDVYALGALLYELLTGRPPFDAKTLMAKGQDEMRRIIREVEPVRPSRRIEECRMTNNESPAAIRHSAFGIRHSRDLDLITLRALEKDRARRYESATALSNDIQRFLDHEPVTARAPSAVYLTRRWVRRHRSLSFAAAAIMVGASLALWQAVRATQARRVAERQLADAEAATKLVTDTLAALPFGGGDPMIKRSDLMAALSKRVLAFDGDPMSKARLLSQMAEVVAPANAITLREEALKIATPLLGPDDVELWRLRLGLAGVIASFGDRREQAMPELRRAHEWFQAHLTATDPLRWHGAFVFARNLNFTGGHAEAAEILGEIVRLGERQPDVVPPRDRAFHRFDFARALSSLGKSAEALEMTRENLSIALQTLGPSEIVTARACLAHAELCHKHGLLDEAATTTRQALNLFYDIAGPLAAYSLSTLERLIEIEKARGDMDALIAVHRDALRAFDARLGPAHEATAERLKHYSQALVAANRADEADKLDSEWLKRVRMPNGTLPAACEQMLRGHIEVLRKLSDWPRAETALRELVSMMQRARPDHPQRHGDQNNLADVLMKQGRHSEAVPLLEEAIAALERSADGEVRRRHLPLAKQRLAEARSR